MEGDLSLSQSLGGLRIANPDDAPTNMSEELAGSTITASTQKNASDFANTSSRSTKSDDRSLGLSGPAPLQDSPPRNPLPARSSSRQNRLSMLPDIQDRHHHPSRSSVHQGLNNPLANSTRPSSTYFPSSTANGPSSNPTSRVGSYRLRTGSSPSVPSEMPSSSDSRGGSAALQAGVPVRDDSYGGSYRTGQGNGPMLPRQGSRAARNSGATPLSGSPYGAGGENAPLQSTEEWQDRGAALGVRQEMDVSGKPVSRYIKKGVRDFSFGRTLGEGSYSTVVAATDRQTLKEYAIKILDKRHIIKEKKVKYVNIEKDTLNRLTDHPGVVRLYYTFQDERSLYFVLDLASGGELLGVLKRMGTFDEECTRYYAAQVLDTVAYMHRRGVIHRDLKPENVLLDSHMHVKITDFGTAKMLNLPSRSDNETGGIPSMDSSDMSEQDRASSFVGTAEYVSPELLTNKNACKASDLWAFGCIVYQLLAGRPPFKAGNEYLTFQKIVGLDYQFPQGFPPAARDLIERLLVHDPARRLQIEHIKNHEFFDGVTWGRGMWKQKPPRLKPYSPPPSEPIKLNGGPSNEDSFPPNIDTAPGPSSSTNAGNNNNNNRPYPRVITDLPPPSQLDIEWSPVLKRSNERILKLGNLMVSSSHRSQNKNGNGDNDPPKKFSRFFGGSTTKKRQRLVLVTSAGRIIIVPAGGDDKKPKMEISLTQPGTQYRSVTDPKGYSSWVVDTNDKHHAFEDAKQLSGNPGTSALSTQEWMDSLDRAKEMASFQSTTPSIYMHDDGLRDLSSGVSSHANTLHKSDDLSNTNAPAGARTTLVKHAATADSDSVKAKKRFSRRQSKNGLSAVF